MTMTGKLSPQELENEIFKFKQKIWHDVAIWMRNRGYHDDETINMEELQECLGDFWNDNFTIPEFVISKTRTSVLEAIEEEIGEDIKIEDLPKLKPERLQQIGEYLVEDTNIERARIRRIINKFKEIEK